MKNYNENKLENVNLQSVTHIRINTDEVYEFIEDKSILDVLEFVKQSYPFTFIGRQKFRRKIDQLNFEFWIKDANEKIVIVNEVFAKSLSLKVSEIEGKTLANLYNETEYLLVKNITAYIVATSNSVIYETFSKKSEEDLIQVVEFPICDIDDNVVAIIGFKQKAFKLENLILDESNSSIAIKDIPAVVVSVSKDFIVENFSDKFYKEFNLNPNSIKKQSLEAIFTIDFSKLMLKASGTVIRIGKNEYRFEYKSINNNHEKGYYFAFNRVFGKNIQNSSSDKMFDMLMYTSPDPMFIYGIEDLRFLKVNDAALKFYGYSEEEFLRMDLTDLYAPEDIQTLVDSSSRNTVERGFTGPWRQKRKDGSTVEVEISKSGIEFNGQKAHFNIIHDISKSIQSDKISNQYKAIFENSSDIIIQTDADGFIQKANESIVEKLGYELASLNERPFLSLVADDYRAKINTTIFHSAFPQKVNFDCELKRADGTLEKVNLVSTPLLGANNEVESFIIIVRIEKEVVVKTVVEKEIINTASAPKATGNLDTEFLSHLFHELLTPVNVIIGFSQELAETSEETKEEAKEAADIIRQNQKILLQLMDNAVQYVELEQNQVKLNPKNVHFVELIDRIETDIKKVSANLNKEFSYGKISSSLQFETDENKLLALTILLLEFAMRATKKDKVYLSAYQSDAGHCVVAIKDDRNAISKELVDGLEEIFRGDENDVRYKYGISRFMRRFALKVAELLADSIGVINKLGEPFEYGFTFPIRFNEKKITEILGEEKSQTVEKEIIEEPVAAKTIMGEVKAEEIKEEKTEEIVEPVEAPTTTATEEKREPITVQVNVTTQSNAQQNIQQPEFQTEAAEQVVTTEVADVETFPSEKQTTKEERKVKFEELSCLYVEDQIDSQILFKVQMKGLKSIEFANSFEKALPLLQSKRYDFIIMDINLQGEYNGLDALRVIQKMPEYSNVPIIAVTAYVLPGDRERFITAGFTDFISKPILRDKLESVLNNIF